MGRNCRGRREMADLRFEVVVVVVAILEIIAVAAVVVVVVGWV